MTSHAEAFRALYLGARSAYAFDSNNLKPKAFHLGEFGRAREKVSQAFLKPLTPPRLAIADGFIVRSDVGVSRQCDLIVYDPAAAPFAGEPQAGLFFPIESVVAIGEIKSSLNRDTFREAVAQLDNLRSFCEVDRKSPFSFLIFERLNSSADERVDNILFADVEKTSASASSSVYLSVADGLLYAHEGQWLEPGDDVSHIKQFGVQYNQAVCNSAPRAVDLSLYVHQHSDDVRHKVSPPPEHPEPAGRRAVKRRSSRSKR
jgi:hypothetical protein